MRGRGRGFGPPGEFGDEPGFRGPPGMRGPPHMRGPGGPDEPFAKRGRFEGDPMFDRPGGPMVCLFDHD